MEEKKDTQVQTQTQAQPERNNRGGNPRGGRGRGPRSGGDRRRPGKPRERSEFDHKIVSIRRVTRVVSGGKRFSFSVGIVAGNRKGKVGVGLGKAADTALAIDKALRDAKKNMVIIPMTKTNSIPHDVEAKYGGSRVLMFPAPERGVIAGSSIRTVIELSGLKDISAKMISRTKNQVNNARVAIEALKKLKTVK